MTLTWRDAAGVVHRVYDVTGWMFMCPYDLRICRFFGCDVLTTISDEAIRVDGVVTCVECLAVLAITGKE
jgi:hypothetical protein